MKRFAIVTILLFAMTVSICGIVAEASTGVYGDFYITYTLTGSGTATKKATGTTSGAVNGLRNNVFVGLYKNSGALVASNSKTSYSQASATASKTLAGIYMAKSTHDFLDTDGTAYAPSYTKRVTWIY